ncbi:MAG: M28 family peptidase [Pyrinomonadaceae bacterium]
MKKIFALLICFIPVLIEPLYGQIAGEYEKLFDRVKLLERAKKLSSDQFEGRGPGSKGGKAATAYIAEELKNSGVQPLGESYFQNVGLIGIKPNPTTILKTKNKSGLIQTLAFGQDLVVFTGAQKNRISVNSEIVFVGYGIDAPQYNWNDYKGNQGDFKNKILLMLVNEPSPTAEEPRLFGARNLTYYGRWTYKFEEAARRGAVGAILIHTDESAGYPWSVVKNSAGNWHYEIARQKGDRSPFLKINSWVTYQAAEKMLKGTGLKLEDLIRSAKKRDFKPVRTGVRAKLLLHNLKTDFLSRNVAGMVEGSDPILKNEFVIYTAHWDHLGLGPDDGEGDFIFNGAYDNASGVAALLSIAEVLAKMPPEQRPKRSFLFLFPTAEEQGLIGSEFYIKNPLVPLEKTLADLNLDGINIFGKTKDFTALGMERSDLADFVIGAAAERDLRVEPDRQPEQGFFYRSDHFPFARAGVPSLSFQHGNNFIEPLGEQARRFFLNYREKFYHQQNDEFADWWDVSAMIQESEVALAVGIKLADAGEFPAFKGNDEFAPADRLRRKKR